MPSALFQFTFVSDKTSFDLSVISVSVNELISNGEGMWGPGYSCHHLTNPVVNRKFFESSTVQSVPLSGSSTPRLRRRNPVGANDTSSQLGISEMTLRNPSTSSVSYLEVL